MCGLAGIYLRTPGSGDLGSLVRQMADQFVHRGPDDSGAWVDPSSTVGFGFRRLAIIDLSTHGHQPMASPSARYEIVFNGEIYNHVELRRELETAGVRFKGWSDTEVLCGCLDRWGVERTVNRLAGMFAIAAWDQQLRRLYLVRDRLGIKPLYYGTFAGGIVFASELKAMTVVDGFDTTIDADALAEYLRYLYIPAPATVYRSVRKLLPGSILVLEEAGSGLPQPITYWSVEQARAQGQQDLFRGNDGEAADALDTLLRKAVCSRMMADVPLGALLSGGVDSSTVVGMMQASASQPVRTFSIGFDVAEHDESAHAAAVARHLGTDHTLLRVSGSDARDVVPLLPTMFDEPLANPSQIPTYLLCKLTRQRVTVALAGDGGDELFAGYNRYVAGRAWIENAARVPRALRRLAAGAIGVVPSRSWDRVYELVRPVLPGSADRRLVGERLSKLGRLLAADGPNGMYRSLLTVWPDADWPLRSGSGRDTVSEALTGCQGDLLDRMMAVDQALYLTDDLLAKTDRASMAASLEVRLPLLDHRVVEFSWSLPRRLKIRGGVGKWLLRKVLRRYVPPGLTDRPKVGFTVPIADWLTGPLRDWAGDLLLGDALADSPLDGGSVRRLWDDFQGGRQDRALALWAAASFEAWRGTWCRPGPQPQTATYVTKR